MERFLLIKNFTENEDYKIQEGSEVNNAQANSSASLEKQNGGQNKYKKIQSKWNSK